MGAMLRCAGERGFHRVTAEEVCRAAGAPSAEFHRYFADEEDCFAAAYEAEGERLCEQLRDHLARGGRRRERLQEALDGLAAAMARRPAVARSMLVEVHAAGQRPAAKRRELLGRLARALERSLAPEEPDDLRPTTAAIFAVGAIDWTLSRVLSRGNPARLRTVIPELATIVIPWFRPQHLASVPAAPAVEPYLG